MPYISVMFLAQHSGDNRAVETHFSQIDYIKFHLVGEIRQAVPYFHLLVF